MMLCDVWITAESRNVGSTDVLHHRNARPLLERIHWIDGQRNVVFVFKKVRLEIFANTLTNNVVEVELGGTWR